MFFIQFISDQHRRLTLLAVVVWLNSFASAAALEQNELDANRALWDSYNILNYDYVMHWATRRDAIRPALVSVRGGIIVAVKSDSPVPYSPQSFLTIEESFDKLQLALDSNAFQVDAQFDHLLGFPSFVNIDRHELVADEEERYSASELFVVAEPGSSIMCMLTLTFLGCSRRRRGT
jgi:hypothetical protein